jgi:hypothetical protein
VKENKARRDHAATSLTHLFSRAVCHVATGVRKQENPFPLSVESKLCAFGKTTQFCAYARSSRVLHERNVETGDEIHVSAEWIRAKIKVVGEE